MGGNNTHAVITAHRGLPTARLFSERDQLKIGDKFYIVNVEGTLAYQVDQVKVIDPHDFRDLVVSPGHDYVTLLTCTPYMVNSHRLLVRGHRIEYVAAVDEPLIEEQRLGYVYRLAFFVTAGALALTLLLLIRGWRRRKRVEAELRRLKHRIADETAPEGSDAGR